jgi:hypothetical protein
MRYIVFGLVLAVSAALAQGGSDAARIGAPALGLLHESSQNTVRSIRGIPGAARLTPPFRVKAGIRILAVSSLADLVLAAAGPECRLVVIRSLSSSPVEVELREMPASPDQILLSPSGTSAALFYRDRKSALTLTGLPDSPAPGAEIDLSLLPEPVTIKAVSDSGAYFLVAAGRDEGAILAAWSPGGLRTVLTNIDVSAAAFVYRSAEAIVADRRSGVVYLLRDIAGGAIVTLATARDGIGAPAAVGISSDNRRAFLADGHSGAVVFLPLDGSAPARLECPCVAKRMEPLRGTAVFRLTDASDGRIWLLDGDAPEMRFVFVPVDDGRRWKGGAR